MDPLRIVLIAVGVVIIGGLYLWERRRRRTRRRDVTPHAPDPLDHLGVAGFSATQAPAEAWEGRGFAAGDEVVAEREFSIPVLHAVVEEGNAALAREQAGDVAEPVTDGEVIVLTVIAATPLPVRRIVDALRAGGLVHGRMAIFHYSPDAEGAGDASWFSAVNVLEPGTFDLDAIDGETTPGVALFTQLPGAAGGEAIWAQMLATARTLADTLGARLCDDKRRPLTEDQIAALAKQARRYSRTSAPRQRA